MNSNIVGPLLQKQCSNCKLTKDLAQFAIRVASKDKLQHRCKECQALMNKRRDQKELYRKYNREYNIRYKYGISVEEYEEILSRGCEICGGSGRLVLDHCHTTSKVRGCLCHNCNTALGLFNDDIMKLNKAIIYLTSD